MTPVEVARKKSVKMEPVQEAQQCTVSDITDSILACDLKTIWYCLVCL